VDENLLIFTGGLAAAQHKALPNDGGATILAALTQRPPFGQGECHATTRT
jgi:hypothetical protein